MAAGEHVGMIVAMVRICGHDGGYGGNMWMVGTCGHDGGYGGNAYVSMMVVHSGL